MNTIIAGLYEEYFNSSPDNGRQLRELLTSAYEAGQVAARDECARRILETPMYPAFILDLCKQWMQEPP